MQTESEIKCSQLLPLKEREHERLNLTQSMTMMIVEREKLSTVFSSLQLHFSDTLSSKNELCVRQAHFKKKSVGFWVVTENGLCCAE